MSWWTSCLSPNFVSLYCFVSFTHNMLMFFWYALNIGVAASYDKCIYIYFFSLQTISILTNINLHVPLLYIIAILLISVLDFRCSDKGRCYLIVLLICVSLITTNIEQFFIFIGYFYFFCWEFPIEILSPFFNSVDYWVMLFYWVFKSLTYFDNCSNCL